MKQNDSSLRVKLYHGVIAYPDGTYSLRDFSARHRNKKGRETPDYAIVFYGKDPAKKPYWVVLDAKSWMKLGVDTMKARDKYMNAVRLHGEKPNQSWIIYSGPRKGFAEIEFDPDDQNQHNWPWTDELKDEDPLAGNAGVTFTRYGLSGENTEGQYVGHVRANVNTIKGCDVFSVFAEGQIEIAKKKLQI